jgi:hypothetical protein
MVGKRFRFTVSVDEAGYNGIKGLAERMSMKTGPLTTVLLMLGYKQLGRQYEPEKYIPVELVQQLVERGVLSDEFGKE